MVKKALIETSDLTKEGFAFSIARAAPSDSGAVAIALSPVGDSRGIRCTDRGWRGYWRILGKGDLIKFALKAIAKWTNGARSV